MAKKTSKKSASRKGAARKSTPRKGAAAKSAPEAVAPEGASRQRTSTAITVPPATASASAMSPAELLAHKQAVRITDSTEPRVHKVAEGIVCMTDRLARKRSPLEIVLDATEGFIPLWVENAVLRWRFNDAALSVFQHEDAIRETVRNLFVRAVALWGDAAPIRFDENPDNSDFEVVVEQFDRCFSTGCTLARAFFPDAGRHDLVIYPKMFEQSEKEQIDTLAHEVGHVFGLRHFFAIDQESQFPAVVFGSHDAFSIMNYGDKSEMTQTDRDDLKTLYELVWSHQLRNIGGTPIKLVRPYHYFDL